MTAPTFTRHARLRMAAMGVTTRQVKRVLYRPQVERPNANGHGPNCRIACGDGLAVVHDNGIVVTVLWEQEFVR